MTREPTKGHSAEYCEGWHDGFEAQDIEIIAKLRAEIEQLRALPLAILLHLSTVSERWEEGPFKAGFETAIEEAGAYLKDTTP